MGTGNPLETVSSTQRYNPRKRKTRAPGNLDRATGRAACTESLCCDRSGWTRRDGVQENGCPPNAVWWDGTCGRGSSEISGKRSDKYCTVIVDGRKTTLQERGCEFRPPLDSAAKGNADFGLGSTVTLTLGRGARGRTCMGLDSPSL